MALSRTARILIAILLLAAAAFFWVNFFYQSRVAETPAQDPVTATPPAPAMTAAEAAAADAVVDAGPEATADAAATQPDAVSTTQAEPTDAVATDAPGVASTPGAATPAVETPSGAVAVVVADDPVVVVVDVPVTVSREVVIADLPFLVTSPAPVATEAPAEGETGDAPVAVTVPTRATINPFSPVVVRTPPPPTREVPEVVAVAGVVPIPAAPAAAVAPAPVRASTPTPRPLAPAAPVVGGLTRDLPSGSVFSSTPDLLRAPRVGTVADRVDLPAITAIAIPAAEPVTVAPTPTPRPPVPVAELRPVGPIAIPVATTDEPTIVVEPSADGATDPAAPPVVADATPGAPLPAGTTRLARYLRDYDYAFTGSVMGPVSVGVFRSQADPTPIVVALGQTLPNTEIVLTDLRGMQAELTLGDSTQILSLDLRR